MRYFLQILMFLLMPLSLLAQDMSVESFQRISNDMDARIYHPEKDPSGRTCAIIKVVNTNKGFVFDTGSVAVVKTKQETGEIWVYVQPGVKRITIKHQDLGVLRNYYFPEPIEEATVYELRLTTGTVHTYVEQKSTTAFLIINSEPEGADVYINDKWVGTTPFNKKYSQGETMQYRVSRALYHDEVGEVVLNNTRTEVSASLKPAFGSISVTSHPSGASVVLDGEDQPRGTTPVTIDRVASGQHRVRVQMPRYDQQVIDVTVTDGGTALADAQLTAAFAEVTVNSLPGATIRVDGEVRGTGTATWEQDAGLCDVEVSLDGHRKQSHQIEVVPGRQQTVTLEPIPMYGAIVIESDPIGADIYIDGARRGITPEVIDRLLATDHTVRLSKSGCADFTVTVTVREGEELSVSGTLSTGETMTVTTGFPGDDIYIDDKFAGKSPYTATIPYGHHTAYAMRGDLRTLDKGFDVNQGRTEPVELWFYEHVDYTVKGVTFRMIPVEGGTFKMGFRGKEDAENNRKYYNEVTLSDYMIGETEVTQALWEAVMGKNPSRKFLGDNQPVQCVSYNDCQEFIKELNKLTGLKFRLPTDAQWEYAAKGGKKSHGYLYSGSDNADEVAWYRGNSEEKAYPVATKVPNELGIYDMSGNVWEICFYTLTSQTNPTDSVSSTSFTCRGGCYGWGESWCVVSINRSDGFDPNARGPENGFRLALEP